MDREERRRISSMGGRASHQNDDNNNNYGDDRPSGRGYRSEDSVGDRTNTHRISNRGFAAMDEEEVRRIASKGGRVAHERGTAHEWSSAEAREAGRIGGRNSHGGGRKGQDNDEDVRDGNRENIRSGRGFAGMDEAEQTMIS